MVLFSIIIPVYSRQFLDTCINSVLMQTFDDFELICIDFLGNPDSSIILNKYSKDDRFNFIKSQKSLLENDKYLSNLRDIYLKFDLNNYLEYIHGNYVFILDCQDWLDLNFLEIIRTQLIDENIDLLIFNKINFDENYVFDYVYDENMEEIHSNKIFNINEKTFEFIEKILSPQFNYVYNFKLLTENNYLNDLVFNFQIFFLEILVKSKKIVLMHTNSYNNRVNVKKLFTDNITIDDFFLKFLSEIEELPLETRDDFYQLFRDKILIFSNNESMFLNFLNEKSKELYYLVKFHYNYLDFITMYLTDSVNYDKIIDSEKESYKLSVIVPIYNTGKILNRTLNSLLNQTFTDFEVVMINDHSNDSETNKISETFASNYNNFKLIYLDDNHGSAGIPRNIGIKESKSEYLMFLDHEDYYEPDTCEFLYNDIISRGCDLVFGNYNVIKNNVTTPYYDEDVKPGFYKNIDENPLFYHSPGASIWTKIFKKELIIKNDIFFIPILGEDWAFLFKYFEVAEGIQYYYDKIVYNYDLRDISTTSNVSLKYFIEGFVGEKYIYDFFIKNKNKNNFKFRIFVFNYFLTLFANSQLNRSEIKRLQPLVYEHFKIFKSLGMNDWNFTKKEFFNIISKNDYSALVNYFLHLKKTILYITTIDKSQNIPLVDNLSKLLNDFKIYALTYENFKIKLWDLNLNKFNIVAEIGYDDKIVDFSQLNIFYETIFNKYGFEKIFFRHFESIEPMVPFRSLIQSQRVTPLSFASLNKIPTIYGKDSNYLLKNLDFNYYDGSNVDSKKERGVVFTAIFGNFESLLDPKFVNKDLDYICFTDNENLKSDIWDVRLISDFKDDFGFVYNDVGEKIYFEDLDSTRKARAIKILPHKFLKSYDFSIWIDAAFLICGDLIEYVNRYSKGDFLAVKHSIRHCIYEEAKEIIKLNIDDINLVSKQMNKYIDEGFPKQYGLIESGVLFRRHYNPKIIKVMEDWFNEILNFSKRDQLSFNYAAWKNNFKYDTANIYIIRTPYFHHYHHIKSTSNNKVLLNQIRIILKDDADLNDLNNTIESINEINDFIPISIITSNENFYSDWSELYNVEIIYNDSELDVDEFINQIITMKSEKYIHIMDAGDILEYDVIRKYISD